MIDKGECEFIEDIAGEMPSFVIADLMGLPLADGRELYRLTEVIHSDPSALPEGAAVEAITKMFEYGAGVIKDKRTSPGMILRVSSSLPMWMVASSQTRNFCSSSCC